MLVLTRRKSECIVIDERIKVYVVEIRENSVRLGIEADREVNIRRSELPAKLPVAALAEGGVR